MDKPKHDKEPSVEDELGVPDGPPNKAEAEEAEAEASDEDTEQQKAQLAREKAEKRRLKKEKKEKKEKRKKEKIRQEEERRIKHEEEQKQKELQEKRDAEIASLIKAGLTEFQRSIASPEYNPTLTVSSQSQDYTRFEGVFSQEVPDFLSDVFNGSDALQQESSHGLDLPPHIPTEIEKLSENVHRKGLVLSGEVPPATEAERQLQMTHAQMNAWGIPITRRRDFSWSSVGSITTLGTTSNLEERTNFSEAGKEEEKSVKSLAVDPGLKSKRSSVGGGGGWGSVGRRASVSLSAGLRRRTGSKAVEEPESLPPQLTAEQSRSPDLHLNVVVPAGQAVVASLAPPVCAEGQEIDLVQGLRKSLVLFSSDQSAAPELPKDDEDVLSLALASAVQASETGGETKADKDQDTKADDWAEYEKGLVLEAAGLERRAAGSFTSLSSVNLPEEVEKAISAARNHHQVRSSILQSTNKNGISKNLLRKEQPQNSELSDYALFHLCANQSFVFSDKVLASLAFSRRQQCKLDPFFCEQVQKYVGTQLLENKNYSVSQECFSHILGYHDRADEESNLGMAEICAERQDFQGIQMYLKKCNSLAVIDHV